MQRVIRRRLLWIGGLLLLLLSGYTAGYLLAPPDKAAISRTLPAVPVDQPQPQAPVLEPIDEV